MNRIEQRRMQAEGLALRIEALRRELLDFEAEADGVSHEAPWAGAEAGLRQAMTNLRAIAPELMIEAANASEAPAIELMLKVGNVGGRPSSATASAPATPAPAER